MSSSAYPNRAFALACIGVFLGAWFVLDILTADRGISGSSSSEPYDSCRLTEPQIRQLWVAASTRSQDEAERTRIAAEAARQAESLCRSGRDARPTPLPAELQHMVR